MSSNNSNINGHLVPETISIKESEVVLSYNTDNNFYNLKENLTVIPKSAEQNIDFIVTEGKDIITCDKSTGIVKIKEGVTKGFAKITIKSKFPTNVKAELKIYIIKSQTITISNEKYHIDKYGALFINDRELKEVGKVKSFEVYKDQYNLTVYAITEDDKLYAWGNNYYGQVGNGSTEDQTTPYELKEVGKVKSFEVYKNGYELTVYAITEDDRLYAWGNNYYGQVGNGSTEDQTTPYEVKEVGKVKSFEVYKNEYELTVYAITEDDKLYAWGRNKYGQVGNGNAKSGYIEYQTTPYEVKEVGKVKSVEVYYDTVYAITEDDKLYAWGYNGHGQVGNGSTKDQTIPYEVKEVGKVKSVEVYGNEDELTVYAITEDNRLYAWGYNGHGQVGNGSTKNQTTPYELKEVGKVKSVEVYEYKYKYEYKLTVYAITEDNRLYAWGWNKYGQVGNGESGEYENQTTPYEVTEVSTVIKSIVTTGSTTVYAITEDDRLYAWGWNDDGQVGNGYNRYQKTPYELKEVGKVKSVEVYGYETVYAITEDDRLYAWGNNKYGQVGNGKRGYNEYQTTPYEVKKVGKVKSVEVYENEYELTVYAITEDDRLYAWGWNHYGQVGNGSTKNQTTPYEVKEVGKVKSVEYGYGTVYAITEDDRLYAWGRNKYGQVGNGSTENQTTPYELKEVGKVKSVEVYEYKYGFTVYAITEDDRLYAWGWNNSGQVGNGKSGYNEDQTTPYEVKEVGKVKSVEYRYGTVYAITEDDRLYAWGWNWSGQVGSGYNEYQKTPYELKEVGKVKSVEVYGNGFELTVYAITADNRLYAWGYNGYGQVGSGYNKYQTTPYELKEVGKVKSVEVYYNTVYAITLDDRLYAWGWNNSGQVGNGSTENQTTPYEVKEVGKVKSVEVYNDRTVYAITEDDRLYAWGRNIQNTPYEFTEIGKIKSFEKKEGNFYLLTIDNRLFTWGEDGKIGKVEIPYEVKEIEE